MCSILGVISRTGEVEPALAQRLPAMLALSRKRGPDESHLEWIEPGVVLGSNRLRIIDLSARSRMPLSDPAGQSWISFNGEVYNHRELRALLEHKGHRFRTESDTEVVLHAFLEWGVNCLRRLNGMFAFAIWDVRARQLFAARDRFGIKPFYYRDDGTHLVVSSDVRPFFLLPGFRRELDCGALTAYLHLRFVPGTRSILQGVSRLAPGEWKRWDFRRGTCEGGKFWEPSYEPWAATEEELAGQLLDHLTNAVSRATTGDVPPDVLLSGGLDSSAVVALLRRLGREKVRSFSCSFSRDGAASPIRSDQGFNHVGSVEDESYYSDLVARRFRTAHQDVPLGECQPEVFREMVYHLGEPLASTDALGHYLFARSLEGRARVVLSGTGSDELLGGYAEMYFKPGCRLMRADLEPLDYLRLFANPDDPRGCVADCLRREYRDDGYCHDHVHLAFFELAFGLPGWELDQADRLYMACSIELRPVFLENQLADFALSIPSRYKYARGQEKYILKRALAGLLPEEVVGRQKFPSLGTPRRWYGMEWCRSYIEKLREDPLPIWDPARIHRLLDQPADSINYDALYRLVAFEAWHDVFLSGNRWI